MSFPGLLISIGDIQRFTTASDGHAGLTKTWATIYRRIACRVNALGSREQAVIWDTQKVLANYVGFTEVYDIHEGDRLVLHDPVKTFEIKMVNRWDELDHHLRLIMVEVR